MSGERELEEVDGSADDGDLGATVDCEVPSEFYGPSARLAIGHHCRRFLEEHALTPTELLHAQRHQQALSNIPIFVGILQQVDRTRSRKGAINGLVNDVARITRERLKDNPPPELTPDGWEGTLAKLASEEDAELSTFLVGAAATACILPYRSYAEKAEVLTSLAVAATSEVSVAIFDQILGEMVRFDTAIASITRDAPMVRAVGLIVDLLALDRQPAKMDSDVPHRLEILLKRWPMHGLRDGLCHALRRQLRRPEHLTIASAGDLSGIEAIQREVMALAEIAGRLRGDDGFVGGRPTEEALQRRGALLINEDTLHEMLRGRGLIEKLRTLFSLQKLPLPLSAERAITAYINQFFEARDFAGRLFDCWKERNDKLKGVAEVQRMVQASIFTEPERERISGMLDEIQATFLRTQRMLGKLLAKEDAPLDMIVDIAKLASENAFCEGRTKTAVGRALNRQVHRPRFLRTFLLSAGDDRMREARAKWLRCALDNVGAGFVDLTALTALVVDDEDGPREFVESVLSDLGLGGVISAVDGQAAIEAYDGARDRVGLIICDWMMPRLSGLEVLRHVRQHSPALPFLMVTALATPKAVHKALEHQVSGYIAKPFTPDQLEAKVLVALTQKSERTV